MYSREELMSRIEEVRGELDRRIDLKEDYSSIYQYSVKLDRLIEEFIAAGF